MKDLTVTRPFSEEDYNELLQQAVAVIEKELRTMLDEVNPPCHLEVDGGVDLNTCVTCKENGADVLVAGSAYFKATDKATFVKEIEA